jgi:hypothetical protein
MSVYEIIALNGLDGKRVPLIIKRRHVRFAFSTMLISLIARWLDGS